MTEVPIIETSPLIFSVNQWTGFYMIGISVMKELKYCENVSAFDVDHLGPLGIIQ